MLPNNDTVDKNLPDNAGDMDSIPGSGRSHKYKQLSLCTTTEPVLQNLGATTPEPTAQHSQKNSSKKKKSYHRVTLQSQSFLAPGLFFPDLYLMIGPGKGVTHNSVNQATAPGSTGFANESHLLPQLIKKTQALQTGVLKFSSSFV